jgi:ribosomal protein S18 acetylase RimI-like enzyme
MSERLIRTVTASEAERCFAVLTLAFAGDPAARWAWPDQQQYVDAFPRFARAFGGRAIDAGTAHHVAGFSGVALWLPPGTSPDEESLVRVIRETVTHELQDAMFSMFEQMDAYHPHEQHWHLPLIGVDPASQGRGYGSALLSHALDECDRQQILAYLEATSPRNVLLYERHGFEVLGTIQVGASPPVFPMLRKPG